MFNMSHSPAVPVWHQTWRHKATGARFNAIMMHALTSSFQLRPFCTGLALQMVSCLCLFSDRKAMFSLASRNQQSWTTFLLSDGRKSERQESHRQVVFAISNRIIAHIRSPLAGCSTPKERISRHNFCSGKMVFLWLQISEFNFIAAQGESIRTGMEYAPVWMRNWGGGNPTWSWIQFGWLA